MSDKRFGFLKFCRQTSSAKKTARIGTVLREIEFICEFSCPKDAPSEANRSFAPARG